MTRGRPSLPYRFLRMLAIRLMQFFGNLLKLMFYVHFKLMLTCAKKLIQVE